MRCLFKLRKKIASKRPESGPLQPSLREFCRAAAAIISETSLGGSPSESIKQSSIQTQSLTASTSLERTSLAVQRSYTSIVQGLGKLCAISDNTNKAGSVVYEVIVLFETI